MNEEDKTKLTDNNAKKPRGKGRPFVSGDPRANLAGRPLGAKNFTTIFQEAIKKIAKSQSIKECDVEIDLVIKAIAEARGGSYQYHKDIFDRVYGQAKETQQIISDDLKEVSGLLRDILNKK